VPPWRCQTHRGQNELPEDGKILQRLQDRLIKIESQTRVYGTSWKVLQSNPEAKLNAVRKSLPTKSFESKVRFAGWNTSQRGSSSQSECLTSEGSSRSASRTTQTGQVWQKGKSWRNIPSHTKKRRSKSTPRTWEPGPIGFQVVLITVLNYPGTVARSLAGSTQGTDKFQF